MKLAGREFDSPRLHMKTLEEELLEFKLNGKRQEYELGYDGINPGQFIQECVVILNELND